MRRFVSATHTLAHYEGSSMRLGGPTFDTVDDPDSWVAEVKQLGWRATFCPIGPDADDTTVSAFEQAAAKADIVIAETGAWSNPISQSDDTRLKAMELCKNQLDLAERIGANCCVNIAGSVGEKWDGPHPDDLTDATYDLIVESVRAIIDAVKPKNSFYCLETMPWMYPDSPDSYVRLIHDIDRSQFGVHMDPVNLICSPQRYFNTGELIAEFIEKLGPEIKSCHAKDIAMSNGFMVHLDEVRPGLGSLDYPRWLRLLDELDPDLPLMLEHLPDKDSYVRAASHIRGVAGELTNNIGVTL